MAGYSTAAPPLRMAGTLAGPSVWYYTSASDSDGTIMTSNYFTNAQDLGIEVGDVFHLWSETDTTAVGSTAWVSVVNSSGCTMIFTVIS